MYVPENCWLWFLIITQSVFRQVHRLFQSELCTARGPALPPSKSSIFTVLRGIPVAVYVFSFVVFSSLVFFFSNIFVIFMSEAVIIIIIIIIIFIKISILKGTFDSSVNYDDVIKHYRINILLLLLCLLSQAYSSWQFS
jgi:hypothetical protein